MRLTIIIILLSVSLANAQTVDRFAGEELEYSLEWHLPLPWFSWIGGQAGRVTMSCQADVMGYQLSFAGQTVNWAAKVYPFDNKASVYIDNLGFVKSIKHCFTDETRNIWQLSDSGLVNYQRLDRHNSLISSDSFRMTRLLDALSAIYYLRSCSFSVGDSIKLDIVGYDERKSINVIRPAIVYILKQAVYSWQGQDQLCWVGRIQIDPEVNIFPGSEIELWATVQDRTPVFVKTNIVVKGFIPSTVEGRLKQYQKSDH